MADDEKVAAGWTASPRLRMNRVRGGSVIWKNCALTRSKDAVGKGSSTRSACTKVISVTAEAAWTRARSSATQEMSVAVTCQPYRIGALAAADIEHRTGRQSRGFGQQLRIRFTAPHIGALLIHGVPRRGAVVICGTLSSMGGIRHRPIVARGAVI